METKPMQVVIELDCEQDTADLAARLAPHLKAGDLILLSGDLGSGKTFFARQLGRELEIADALDSPSFVLMKEYHDGRIPVFHLDLYRFKYAEELYDLGIIDMMDTGITLIEWPERVQAILPADRLEVGFSYTGESSRRISLVPHGSRAGKLVEKLASLQESLKKFLSV